MMGNIILAMSGLHTLRALDMYIYLLLLLLLLLLFETKGQQANAKAHEAIDHLTSFQSS
jgi:hypothetical protein